jgi:hypothetical protein
MGSLTASPARALLPCMSAATPVKHICLSLSWALCSAACCQLPQELWTICPQMQLASNPALLVEC